MPCVASVVCFSSKKSKSPIIRTERTDYHTYVSKWNVGYMVVCISAKWFMVSHDFYRLHFASPRSFIYIVFSF